jgi:hypothetical protein
MLPDLRIVIAAVISTFVLTVGVGFFASSRLITEPKRSADSLAAFEETPVNRIALSWPAPTPQSESLALDFAVTARALRNPVRDVTHEPVTAEQPSPPARSAATDLALPTAKKAVQAVPAPVETAPMVTAAPQPAPEPEIRVAVHYPPIAELSPELQAPATPVVAPAAAAAPPIADTAATTGSLTKSPKSAKPIAVESIAVDQAAPAATLPETKTARRPEPAEAGFDDDQAVEYAALPKPAPKTGTTIIAPKKAAAKKAAPRRIVRRPVRRAAPRVPNTVPNFFGFFTFQQRR